MTNKDKLMSFPGISAAKYALDIIVISCWVDEPQ